MHSRQQNKAHLFVVWQGEKDIQPDWNLNPGPLAFKASAQLTELFILRHFLPNTLEIHPRIPEGTFYQQLCVS